MSRIPKAITATSSSFNISGNLELATPDMLPNVESMLNADDAAKHLNPEAATLFNLAPYAPQKLIDNGFSYVAALRFVGEHQTIGWYVMQKKDVVDVFKVLQAEVQQHVDAHYLDWRDDKLVSYDMYTTIMIALLGCMRGFSSITKWVAEINNNISTRAFITVLFPKALPPWVSYNPNSVYRLLAMFADSCYGDTVKNEAKAANKSGMAALQLFFKNLRQYQAKIEVDLFSYAPTSGFLKGVTFKFSTPRYGTTGLDGQELRASSLPTDGSPNKHYTTVNLFDCTYLRAVDNVIRIKKNQEAEAFKQMLMALVAAGVDLRNVIFVADALNTRWEILAAIEAAGAKYLLIIKDNNGNKALRVFMDGYFATVSDDQLKTFVSPVQHDHGRDEQVTIKAVSASQVKAHPDLSKPAELSVNMANPLPKYMEELGVKTIVKYDKSSVERRDKFSTEALAKLNAKAASAEEQAKRHRTYISNVDLNIPEAFEKLLCSLNEHWMYEVAHNYADTVLKQDRLQMSDAQRLCTRVGFNKISLDFGLFCRERIRNTWKDRGHVGDDKTSLDTTYTTLSDPISFIDNLCAFFAPALQVRGI